MLGEAATRYHLAMPDHAFPEELEGLAVHLIGAKGTGMCALAELLVDAGASVSGSDVEEEFYTDAVLADIGVPVFPFERGVLPAEARICVRSAAYGEENPVVSEALERGIPLMSYPEALGSLSTRFDASAVAGVHGKTTTTALAGTLLKALEAPATVVVGSAVSGFGDRSTWRGGSRYLVAETCEYRRHFLHFRPRRIVLTGVESDHQDFYPDYASIRDAFLEFVLSLPENGELIYCIDDEGAREVSSAAAAKRPDIRLSPYGEGAPGPWKVTYSEPKSGRNGFRVEAFDGEFELAVPGRHIALDAAAALALVESIRSDSENRAGGGNTGDSFEILAGALAGFRGSRRRSEIIGEEAGILVMDDYAHHPTAIAATLAGLKDFHPDRRLLVDFMPHTYSRTAALLEEFASAFGDADILALHPIYASAREAYEGGISGKDLFEMTAERRGERPTLYHETLEGAEAAFSGLLRPGDLFITLGAGNNRPLGRRLLDGLKSGERKMT